MTKLELAKKLIQEKTDKKTGKCLFSKKKLGELLKQRYPTEFSNSDAARSVIRRLTGASGDKQRKAIKNQIEWPGLQLPEPEKNDYSKFVIKEKRIGVLSDIHFPYYDKDALNAAIKYLKSWKPDCILLNGDILDCYHLSTFEKDPRNRKFSEEVKMLKLFFDQLKKVFRGARIIYKQGNHEERYEKRILSRLPEFVDLKWTSFKAMLKEEGIDVEVVGNKRLLKVGKLTIGHGHELPRGIAAPVNPARGFYLKTKSNFLGGHHHQESTHVENDINEQITAAWSTGCLCDLHPDYMPNNKWSHGFATVENFGSDFKVQNLKIIKGKVM
jgi:predicted phosphodiesterase